VNNRFAGWVAAVLLGWAVQASLANEGVDPALLADPVVTLRWTSPSTLVIGSSSRSGHPAVYEEIDAETAARRPLTAAAVSGMTARRLEPQQLRSRKHGPETAIVFRNDRAETISLFWVDQQGKRHSYG